MKMKLSNFHNACMLTINIQKKVYSCQDFIAFTTLKICIVFVPTIYFFLSLSKFLREGLISITVHTYGSLLPQATSPSIVKKFTIFPGRLLFPATIYSVDSVHKKSIKFINAPVLSSKKFFLAHRSPAFDFEMLRRSFGLCVWDQNELLPLGHEGTWSMPHFSHILR